MLTAGEQMIMDEVLKLRKDVSHLKKLNSGFIEPKDPKAKPLWVPFQIAHDFTGWDKERMRRYKKRGLVACRDRENGKGIEYDLNSIDPKLIIKKPPSDDPTPSNPV